MAKVITIGREFGSGGREFGRRLAQELNIEYYDREIITEIANHTSLSEEYVKQIIECKPHSLYPITVGHTISFVDDYAFKQLQSVYAAQDIIIKDLASKSDCIIVGRCADYILKDINPFKIFVYADIESRIQRCLSRKNEDENFNHKQMKKHILNIDKNRARYYNFYTGQKWGDRINYDLCINTTNTEIKSIVPIVAKMFE